MVTKILNTIKRNNMLSEGEHVLVAFSGGADSSVLLDVLVSLRKELGIKVSAFHLNHMLRGKDADSDCEFARKRCKELNVPFTSERADVAAIAKAEGQSTELAARNIRYALLRQAKEDFGADKIATAHNANDNLETIIFNMSRGSGLDGICGIPPVREDIIRPLIEVTRDEIERYAEEKSISFCTDSTNEERIYSRNKIRHGVIPGLLEINSSAIENASRMSGLLRSEASYLNECAEKKAEEIGASEKSIERKKLLDIPEALFGRVCENFAKRALGRESYTLEFKHISDIKKLCESSSPSGEICLPKGLRVRREYEKLVFELVREEERLSPTELKPGENKYGDYSIFVKKAENGGNVNNSVNTFSVLCDRICGSLFVRSRQEGDKIRLLKRCEKSLKKLFIEEHIPKTEREKIPVIADEKGVVAVFGIGTDERYISGEEGICLQIEIKKER